jgi:hypothetical protein
MKRENVGVYVTLTLFGAGVGLIVGAYIASFISDRRVQKILEEQDGETKSYETGKAVARTHDQEGRRDKPRRAAHPANEHEPESGIEHGDDSEEPSDGDTRGRGAAKGPESVVGNTRAGDPIPRKRGRGRDRGLEDGPLFEDPDDMARWSDITSKYVVTEMQQELAVEGIINLDDLVATLEETSAHIEPEFVDYGSASRQKPDLAALAKEPIPEDPDRFVLAEEAPDGKIIYLEWNPDNETLCRVLETGAKVRISDVEGTIDRNVLDSIHEYINFGNFDLIYAHDTEKDKHYGVRLPEEESDAIG